MIDDLKYFFKKMIEDNFNYKSVANFNMILDTIIIYKNSKKYD